MDYIVGQLADIYEAHKVAVQWRLYEWYDMKKQVVAHVSCNLSKDDITKPPQLVLSINKVTRVQENKMCPVITS